MSLEQVLRDGLRKIRSGLLANEAQVKQAVILPILRDLDWDDTDPSEFKPELSVIREQGKGSVDYALGRISNDNPLVFIEAKKLGHANTDGEDQLFTYTANRGVPFLILTDGAVWNFYLSMADGLPAERRFYRMELQQEEKLAEYAEAFHLYLRKGKVLSGSARREAEEQRENRKSKERVRDAIPGCWRRLLNEPDTVLCDALVEAVEKECGIRPELDDVESFLKGFISESGNVVTNPPTSPLVETNPGLSGKIVGYELDGRLVETGAGNRTLAALLTEFDRRDPDFMDRFAAKTSTAKRHLVDRNRDDLYISSPKLKEYSLELGNGWWLGTNLGMSKIREYIETACNVIGVRLGSNLKLVEK